MLLGEALDIQGHRRAPGTLAQWPENIIFQKNTLHLSIPTTLGCCFSSLHH